MKVAVLGYGLQGQSAAKYWHLAGNQITICDQNINIVVPDWANSKLGSDHLNNLDEFDLIVRSPVIHPSIIINANDQTILGKVTTTTNEFFKVCPSKNIIGVTGTKGKGTTSTLISKILEASGKIVHLGGNIGLDPLLLLENNIQPEDWVVLELANFQLIDLQYSPHIAVCLMVVPEHQDWHQSPKDYYESKKQMFSYQDLDDIAIYNAKNDMSTEIANCSGGKMIPYSVPKAGSLESLEKGAYVYGDSIMYNDTFICKINEVELLGRHNLENICASLAVVWQITGPEKLNEIKETIKNFKGLEHRLEYLGEKFGIKYYNDSFATTPEATIAAIRAIKLPTILILGGSDKGSEYFSLINEIVNSNVKRVIAIGDTGPYLSEKLRERGFNNVTTGGNTMEDIVSKAQSFAIAGDVILLSTACASFGLFKNYKDRGEQFKQFLQK